MFYFLLQLFLFNSIKSKVWLLNFSSIRSRSVLVNQVVLLLLLFLHAFFEVICFTLSEQTNAHEHSHGHTHSREKIPLYTSV